MSLLIESIKLHDGKFFNLPAHEDRMRRSLRALFDMTDPVRLEEFVHAETFPQDGLYKCRIVYDADKREKTYTRYEPKAISRIRIVEDNDISYAFKLADRSAIDRLFDQRGDCDDVLIVSRGKVTDCSFSNIAFREGDKWFTPDSPLLAGTMRGKLIRENKILAKEILPKHIRSFDSFKLINAMLEFDGPEIEVSKIVF